MASRMNGRWILAVAGVGVATLGTGVVMTGCEASPERVQQRVFEERASSRLTDDGDAAVEKGQIDRAIVAYSAAIERHSGAFEARRKLAALLIDRGEYQEAREHILLVLTQEPNDPEVLDLSARALVGTGDAEGVERTLGTRARRTNAPSDWARYGGALAALGDTDAAESALLRAARMDQGQTADYQVALGELYRQIGDERRAMQRYRMALYLDVQSEMAQEGIRALGEVPGPSFALMPTEARDAARQDSGSQPMGGDSGG